LEKVFDSLKFSTYFISYSLYEDADFTLRVAKWGEVVFEYSCKTQSLSQRPEAQPIPIPGKKW
jgi:hypothetical protein